jgi:apolipoprotein D and lipocalin family protein
MKKTFAMIALLMFGCVKVPEDIPIVEGFDLSRYLGKWYEIARFDHSFERGLTQVSATYLPREDGGIRVVNRGYNARKEQWKEAVGKAYFTGSPSRGSLKVSFFGPFYGSYNIMELDRKDYSYAMVCGPSKKYFWILARKKTLARDILDDLLGKAQKLGFDTLNLIYVKHED